MHKQRSFCCLLLSVSGLDRNSYHGRPRADCVLHNLFLSTLCTSSPAALKTPLCMGYGRHIRHHNGWKSGKGGFIQCKIDTSLYVACERAGVTLKKSFIRYGRTVFEILAPGLLGQGMLPRLLWFSG